MAIDFGITFDMMKKIGEILGKVFGGGSGNSGNKCNTKIILCSHNNNNSNNTTINITLVPVNDADKITKFDTSIDQSFKISGAEISGTEYTLWLKCSTREGSEHIAFGTYLMYSGKDGEELPLWIGVQVNGEIHELTLCIDLFGKKKWEPVIKNNKEKWDHPKSTIYWLPVATFNEKSSEELLSDLARELNELFTGI